MIDLLFLIIQQGLVFLLVLIGVHLTSRVIRFSDLTVEGSFGLGGALSAWLLATAGLHGVWACCASLLAGGCAGALTAALYLGLGVHELIAGIIVTTALYSLNLALAGSYQSLMQTPRLCAGFVAGVLPQAMLVLAPLAVLLLASMVWFLRTQIGFMLQASGQNPRMVTALGKRVWHYHMGALVLANALTALAGSLFAQYLGFFSIASNVGVLIIALAGLLLGDCFGGPWWVRVLGGSCAYPALVACVLWCGLDPVWNKAAIAVLMVVLLAQQKMVGSKETL